MAGKEPEVMILPFRREYYELVPEKAKYCQRTDFIPCHPRFPFLGTHFTRRIDGSVDARAECRSGPQARRLSLDRFQYTRYSWRTRISGVLAHGVKNTGGTQYCLVAKGTQPEPGGHQWWSTKYKW
jgi:L-2-hydroxyglutarate oxidase LhgO